VEADDLGRLETGADVRRNGHSRAIQFGCASALLISACAEVEPGTCGETFCLPAEAHLIGKQEVADFNLYQVEWRGERFGIYEGGHPDFAIDTAATISTPIDAAALFFMKGKEGHVLARQGREWSPYLHLVGPCSTRADCSVVAFAGALARPR